MKNLEDIKLLKTKLVDFLLYIYKEEDETISPLYRVDIHVRGDNKEPGKLIQYEEVANDEELQKLIDSLTNMLGARATQLNNPQLPAYAQVRQIAEAMKEMDEIKGIIWEQLPIDSDHLDCFWYGGTIGTIQFKNGWSVEISVQGDVRMELINDCDESVASYVNKNNDGAYGDDIRHYITGDEDLHQKTEDNRIYWGNNNWVEWNLFDPDGNFHDMSGSDNVLDDNILDAFRDLSTYVDVIADLSTTHQYKDPKLLEYVSTRAEQFAKYCIECDSENCIFNPDGICLAPIVLGRDLDWSEDSGCHDFRSKEENNLC